MRKIVLVPPRQSDLQDRQTVDAASSVQRRTFDQREKLVPGFEHNLTPSRTKAFSERAFSQRQVFHCEWASAEPRWQGWLFVYD